MGRQNIYVEAYDADHRRLQTGFYFHIGSHELVEFNNDAAGIRIRSGFSGEQGNIVSESDAAFYRKAKVSEVRELARNARKRLDWLMAGLPFASVSHDPKE